MSGTDSKAGLRDMVRGDFRAVARLHAESTCAMHGVPVDYGSIGPFVGECADFLSIPVVFTRVLVTEGRIVGACFGSVSPLPKKSGMHGSIIHLFAAPDTWGKGVGEALWQDAMAKFRDGNAVDVRLQTESDNVRALRFFKRRGFRIGGGRRERLRPSDAAPRKTRYLESYVLTL